MRPVALKPVKVLPVTLRGWGLVLEPLSVAHARALAEVSDATTFQHFPAGPAQTDWAGMEAYIQAALHEPTRVAFAVLLRGKVVGSSSYLDIRPAHLGLEIGATFYAPGARGTLVNPACKLLMLAHAFDTLDMQRVQLKCDARNAASIGAITKLGATREGVMRKHMVMPDGFVRDTVMFSVIRDEWPGVRRVLVERLHALGARENDSESSPAQGTGPG